MGTAVGAGIDELTYAKIAIFTYLMKNLLKILLVMVLFIQNSTVDVTGGEVVQNCWI